MFIIVDGDDIGRKITSCYLTNDVDGLSRISSTMTQAVGSISDTMRGAGLSVHFCAADGVVGQSAGDINCESLFGQIQRAAPAGYTFSAGSGETLAAAYMALTYAKSTGKNVHVGWPLAESLAKRMS